MTDMNARIRALEIGMELLRRRLEQRAISQPQRPSHDLRVTIVDGNTLSTGQLGIKWSGTAITSFSSAYDPAVTSAFPDGIGRGTLTIDGYLQTGYVLVVNDASSGIGHALLVGDQCAALGSISMPVGSGTATVLAYRVA